MRKIGIVGFLLVALILLSGCALATIPPSPLPPPAPPSSAPTPTPPRPEIPPEVASSPPSPAQPSPPSSTVPESHIPDIPLNVTIDYIGVTSAHDQEDIWDPDGEVQLLVLITDGKETPPVSLPPDETGFKMGDFELMNQLISKSIGMLIPLIQVILTRAVKIYPRVLENLLSEVTSMKLPAK